MSPLLRSVLLRKLNMELSHCLEHKRVVGPEMVNPCRNTILELLAIPDESYNDLLENCIAALVNRSDFEFFMSITDHRYDGTYLTRSTSLVLVTCAVAMPLTHLTQKRLALLK